MVIGGEHFFLPFHLLKKSHGYIDSLNQEFQEDYDVNFTFGGYYSILAIINAIKSKLNRDSIVLLPSYLCPSIIIPFKINGINYKFYKVDYDLIINTEYLVSIIDDNVKAVFFIDYFGVSQIERLQAILELLKLKKITVIQDAVQCLEIKKEFIYGDFVFNSFRKFFPFEGSLLLSKETINIEFSPLKNKFILYKRIGQILRFLNIRYKLFNSNLFLSFLQKADNFYYVNQIQKMPRFNYNQLNKINIQNIINNQRYYFLQLFKKYENKQPYLLRTTKFAQLGFVIRLNNRDEIRSELFKQNIFPPIHWLITEEIDNFLFINSIKLSLSIMTIPLIGMTDIKLKYLFNNLNKLIKDESLS